MSRHKQHHHGHGDKARGHRRQVPSSRNRIGGVELAVLLFFVGVVVIGGGWMLLGTGLVALVAALYVAVILLAAAIAAVQAARGSTLRWWGRPFATLALRPAGFGTRGGRPIEAAHDEPAALRAAATFATICVVLAAAVVAAAVLL